MLATATAARWFEARRGLALAIVLIGFNVGYMTGGPVAAMLIAHAGWRAAYLVLGISVCVLGGLASLVVRFPGPERRPGEAVLSGARARPSSAPGPRMRGAHDAGSHPAPAAGGMDLAHALRDPRLWLLTVSWFLFGAVLMMVTVHSVSYARDRGIGLEVAALALTAYGVGAVVGRLGSGLAVDRFGNPAAMAWSVGIQVASLLLLLGVSAPAPLLLLVGVFGLGVMGADTVIAKAIPDVFGVKALGAIMGVLALGWRSGAALGPAAAGFLYDLTGSYAIPFGAGPVLVAVAFALFALVSRRRRPARGRADLSP